ncbi:MAG: ABC transporter substrate-binding protein [Candidatus Bathyarchaeota archaeon]|nr:ABC transporter substrate-binding protein [Candidatus Bathyarchaeum tardum]WGM89273.1 MAG: ABC transporter substrate-binding protein [Candidatus Bathyarchaeum tardum]WNZ28493.1 MAG: ABC transporter substrate-binding protein [Candidatus Bathyarchaeota archaeon]
MNTKTIIIIIAAIAVVSVGALGYVYLGSPSESNELEYPITITDGAGNTVTFAEYPERIVSIAPSCTEILFSIGLEDKIVGVPIYDNYSPEIQSAIASGKIATVGDFQTISVESVVALDPDLILSKGGFQLSTANRFIELDKTVVIVIHSGFTGYLDDISLIGQITGNEQEAAAVVAGIQADAQLIEDKVSDLEKPTVYVEYGSMNSFGGNSVVNELITLAGGVNVFADYNGQYLSTSTEEILNVNPDIIIISEGVMSSYYSCTPEEIKNRESWNLLNAVINDAVYEVDENLITVAGPNIVDGIQQLAEIFHPEAFAES